MRMKDIPTGYRGNHGYAKWLSTQGKKIYPYLSKSTGKTDHVYWRVPLWGRGTHASRRVSRDADAYLIRLIPTICSRSGKYPRGYGQFHLLPWRGSHEGHRAWCIYCVRCCEIPAPSELLYLRQREVSQRWYLSFYRIQQVLKIDMKRLRCISVI